jgi:hypothetical protein
MKEQTELALMALWRFSASLLAVKMMVVDPDIIQLLLHMLLFGSLTQKEHVAGIMWNLARSDQLGKSLLIGSDAHWALKRLAQSGPTEKQRLYARNALIELGMKLDGPMGSSSSGGGGKGRRDRDRKNAGDSSCGQCCSLS